MEPRIRYTKSEHVGPLVELIDANAKVVTVTGHSVLPDGTIRVTFSDGSTIDTAPT